MFSEDNATTVLGAAGEALKAAAAFIPPPYNLIALGLGAALTAAGFYMAKDRSSKANPSGHVVNVSSDSKESFAAPAK